VQVGLFGGFRILAEGRPSARPLAARQQELVALPVLHADTPLARAQVAGRLWPSPSVSCSAT
jgi:DNA-binding SARP family transcriptional activator